MAPETRYAKTADGVHVAYQVFGGGPTDIVLVMGWTTNAEAMWEEPGLARWLERLGRVGRVVLFDKRGVGLSDRVPEDRLPTLETRMDDVRAVMDAARLSRAVVFGVSEGGPMSILFAATYPERTVALVLYGTASDFKPERRASGSAGAQRYLQDVERSWGTEDFARRQLLEWAAPSVANDEGMVRWLASYLRRAASPGAAMALQRMNWLIDVTPVLKAIHVPTLVIARSGDLDFPLADVRTLADGIRGARFVEQRGVDHFPWVGDGDAMVDEIERFVAVVRDEEAELDRVLVTVLFTDIVGSTEMASELGDARWRELLSEHHTRIRALLGRYRGREVDTAGDGFLATFDGPIRAVRCALAAVESVRDLGIQIRAGLHTGEVQLEGSQVRGIAVHLGARVSASAGASEVLVSSTVKDLVAGSALGFEDRGDHELKGIPGTWRLFRVIP